MSTKPEYLGWLIKRIQHRHHRALDKDLASIGLTLVQWNALREIERNPGCSQHQLAELTFNSDQALGTLLTRLHKADLVTPYSGGGRVTLHELSAKGKKLQHEGQQIMQSVTRKSFKVLSAEEQEKLACLLGKILDQEVK